MAKTIKPAKLKAVIFDIDGVLIDSFKANLRLFQNIFKLAGYKIRFSARKYKNFFFKTSMEIFQEVTEGDSKEIARLMRLLKSYARSNTDLTIMPGSIEAIRKLEKKYKLALVTGRIKIGVDNYLKLAKNRKVFRVIVHFGHYKNPKPHPEPLLVACRRLRIMPSQAIYIGDAPSDLKAAKAAGMKFILFSKNKIPGADGHVQEFVQIPKTIEKIWNN
jgi:HAD superfamily hydrolase (TIGR01662 family)